MKKNNKDKSPEKSVTKKKVPVITTKKGKPGSANSSFPQEYEEQQNIDIRMKPQPFKKK